MLGLSWKDFLECGISYLEGLEVGVTWKDFVFCFASDLEVWKERILCHVVGVRLRHDGIGFGEGV